MTLNRWFVVLVSTATLAGCRDAAAPIPKLGEFAAQWAGSEWIGVAGAFLKTGGPGADTLYVYATGPTNVKLREEALGATVAFKGTGTYALGPGAASFQQTVGGDVITATYLTSPQARGTLVITTYSGIGGEVEGVLSFDAVSNDRYAGFGTRASLENGRFRATLKKLPGNN